MPTESPMMTRSIRESTRQFLAIEISRSVIALQLRITIGHRATEIRKPHIIIVQKPLRRSFNMDDAISDDVTILSQQQSHSDVLLDQQYRHAVTGDAMNGTENVEHHLRGQSRTWLIQHDHFGVRHKASPNADHLQLPPG